ncbi:hypothetical protein CYK79_16755 [Clostridium perfringens]|nr:hypothetical protein BXT94_17505 [Clostridium perfringens]QTZ83014.1 hypothetical protein phiCPE_00038 [Clostridium phage vB_CpeS-1181]PWW86594.1 hypothetical protein CYK79_16755 [Clostridium perfringens]PWW90369.1 hypothetical protein CYK84_14550 [Clostridium perfringens]PWX45381.1 hypothetical protein CYK72_15100 [Clostridium perfringens]
MKKFLLFLKIICFLMILIEILLLVLPVVIGISCLISCLISPDFYTNMSFESYELFKLIIIVLLMFLFLIYLIILILKNNITRKTNDKSIIYLCILITLYYVFIVEEQILNTNNLIPLIPMVLIFIYIFLKNILLKIKDI